MTKQRNQYTYELTGRIASKKKRNSKAEKYQGTYYYQLNVSIDNDPKVERIFAFPSAIENEAIWKDIEETNYIRKEYVFFCKNYMGNYRLINWKELPNSTNKNHGNN